MKQEVRTEFTLDGDNRVFIPGLHSAMLRPDEQAQLLRLVNIENETADGVYVTKNSSNRVGRVVVKGLRIVVPPPFDPRLFVSFFLYASGADLSQYLNRQVADVDLVRLRRTDLFLVLLGRLLVEAAEQLLDFRLARSYEPKTERLRVLRGRPLWANDFCSHPANGISCSYRELTHDNLLNRLILAGLAAVTPYLSNTPWQRGSNTQVFLWSSLAQRYRPNLVDFIKAERLLNRLTEHYRTALSLSRAFIFGFSPESPFYGSSAPLQSLEFSLPYLFQDFIARLLREVCGKNGLQVSVQESHRDALTNDLGRVYRSVQPDIVIYKDTIPLAIIDTKYKPRYVKNGLGENIPSSNKVSSADIYQMYFYQSCLQASMNLSTPPIGIIVAPQVPSAYAVSDQSLRTILWNTMDERFELLVIPFPIANVVKKLEKSGPVEALSEAEEFAEILSKLSNWSIGAVQDNQYVRKSSVLKSY